MCNKIFGNMNKFQLTHREGMTLSLEYEEVFTEKMIRDRTLKKNQSCPGSQKKETHRYRIGWDVQEITSRPF